MYQFSCGVAVKLNIQSGEIKRDRGKRRRPGRGGRVNISLHSVEYVIHALFDLANSHAIRTHRRRHIEQVNRALFKYLQCELYHFSPQTRDQW